MPKEQKTWEKKRFTVFLSTVCFKLSPLTPGEKILATKVDKKCPKNCNFPNIFFCCENQAIEGGGAECNRNLEPNRAYSSGDLVGRGGGG